MLSWWRRRGSSERGQSALEFVFVLPFVFIVIFLVAEATNILKTWMVLENASREGARAAAVGKTPDEACTQMRSRAGSILSGSGCGSGVNVDKNGRDPQGDPFATASIQYSYTFQTPLMGFVSAVSGGFVPPTIQVDARTVMRIE